MGDGILASFVKEEFRSPFESMDGDREERVEMKIYQGLPGPRGDNPMLRGGQQNWGNRGEPA